MKFTIVTIAFAAAGVSGADPLANTAISSCDSVPNCLARNRFSCEEPRRTCGECLDGYVSPETGTTDRGNVPCVRLDADEEAFSLPTVDIAKLSGEMGKAAQEEEVEVFVQACTGPGFMYLVNHGVDQSHVDNALEDMRVFFDQSVEEKMKHGAWADPTANVGYVRVGAEMLNEDTKVGDPKESFDLKKSYLEGDNYWAKTTIPTYRNELQVLKRKLLRGLALALKRDTPELDEEFFVNRHVAENGTLRLLHYPPTSGDMERAGPHTDYGTFTILYQDSVGGLEVFNRISGTWQPVPTLPNSFILNIADLLMRWTNDKFVSTLHRVMSQSGNGSCGTDRYSIAMFVDPDQDVVVDPRELLKDPSLSKYPVTTPREYLIRRLTATNQQTDEK